MVVGLEARGHVTRDMGQAGSVVGAIAVHQSAGDDDGSIKAAADYRKAGGVDGF